MSRLLKIAPNTFENENRDKRELSVIKELDLNHEIIVIAKGHKNEIKIIDDFEVHTRTTRPLGNKKILVKINRLVSLITWAYYARKIEPDIISGHDLTGLFIGWLSSLFMSRNKKPLLVYDSHEFEIGRNASRGKLAKLRVSIMEGFLIKRTVFNIMVNDSIADKVQRIYELKDKPVVVRNIPNYWEIDKEVCKKNRVEIIKKFNIPKDSFLVMYHGGITNGRGIENLIKASSFIDGTSVIILGFGEKNYINKLNEFIMENNMKTRVFFLDAVSSDELWKYVGSVDLGTSIIENTCKSYYYSLPNKLFENIQSLTPTIGSNFPEIKKIIEGYDIGICCNPHSVEDIAKAIEEMKENSVQYDKFKGNLKLAKEELCWENEQIRLKDAYIKAFNLIDYRNTHKSK